MEQIRCDNLTLKYGVKTLFENLTFFVNQGDYLCIVGENGSGKTTLMKSLLGMKAPVYLEDPIIYRIYNGWDAHDDRYEMPCLTYGASREREIVRTAIYCQILCGDFYGHDYMLSTQGVNYLLACPDPPAAAKWSERGPLDLGRGLMWCRWPEP